MYKLLKLKTGIKFKNSPVKQNDFLFKIPQLKIYFIYVTK